MDVEENIPAEDSGEPDDWVTIAQYHGPADAHMDRLWLESEGIACNLLDEQFTTIDPFASFASGGIRLQVPRSQLADAQALVRTEWKSQNEEQITCPVCGKTNATRLDLEFPQLLLTGIRFAALFLVGMILPFFYKVPMRCRECNHTWEIRSQIFSRWKAK